MKHTLNDLTGFRTISVIAITFIVITSQLMVITASADEIGSEAFGSALGRFNSIKAADIDDDGLVEIVFGNMEGFLYIIEADKKNNFRKEWQSDFIDTRLWGTELGDVDLDGGWDIVTGGWDGYTYTFDAVTHERKWRSEKMKSDAHGTFIADSDSDGYPEVIVGTGYRIDAGRLHVLSGANGTEEWSNDIVQKEGFTGHSFRGTNVYDIDGDGTNEILVGFALKQGETDGEGYLQVYDGKNYTLEYESPDLGGDVEAIEVIDIDSDGDLEIVTISGYRLRPGGVYVFDAKTLEQEWRSPDYGPKPYGLDAGDVDNDGVNEIVVGNEAGIVRVLNGITHEVEWTSDILGTDALGIEIADVNQDGTPDIIVGVGGYRGKSGYSSTYSQGYIYIFDGRSHELLWKVGELDWVKWGYQVVALIAVVVILIGINRYLKYRHSIKHAGAKTGRLGSAEKLSVTVTADQSSPRFRFKNK